MYNKKVRKEAIQLKMRKWGLLYQSVLQFYDTLAKKQENMFIVYSNKNEKSAENN